MTEMINKKYVELCPIDISIRASKLAKAMIEVPFPWALRSFWDELEILESLPKNVRKEIEKNGT